MRRLESSHAAIVRAVGAHIYSPRRCVIALLGGAILAISLALAFGDSLVKDWGVNTFIGVLAALAIYYLMFAIEFSFHRSARITAYSARRARHELRQALMLHYFLATIPVIALAVALLVYLMFKWLDVLASAIIGIDLIAAVVFYLPELITSTIGALVQLYETWLVLVSLPFLGVYLLLAMRALLHGGLALVPRRRQATG